MLPSFKLSLFFLLGILTLSTYAGTEPDCQRFKEGKFRLTTDQGVVYIIERHGNLQTEYNDSLKLKIEFEVEWISECTYELNFSRILQNDFDQDMGNEWRPVQVEILETKSNSYMQQTTMTGSDLVLKAEIFRIDDKSESEKKSDLIDEQKVRKTFEDYKSAILNNRGKVAVKFLDKKTREYYKDRLADMQNADSATVSNMGFLDKLIILAVRHRASPKEIRSFNGKTLLIFAFNNGMVGKDNVVDTELGEITIDGNFARANFVKEGKTYPLYFHFYREKGKWKLNLTSLFPIGEIAFQKIIEESGLEANYLIMMSLEAVTGTPVGNEVWHPVK